MADLAAVALGGDRLADIAVLPVDTTS